MRNVQRGFSLVELMIASTIGLIVFAGVVSIFLQASSARAELERTSQQLDNGRYAIEVLTQELQLAGYYGELNVGALASPGALPDVCSTSPADWVAAIPLHVQGFDEGAAAPTCVPATLRAATDILAIRRVRTCVAGSAGCDATVATEPYLQVSLCGNSNSTFLLGRPAATTFNLTSKDCASASGIRRYVANIYFVANDNGSGAAIPTLKRLELGAGGFVEVPLVEGIERLQIEYGVDADGDGAPEAYTANPSSYACGGCTALSNWSNVVTANVYVLARSLDVSPGYNDTKIYDLGIDASGNPNRAGPFNDGYRRHVYTAAIRLMNPSGRRDRP